MKTATPTILTLLVSAATSGQAAPTCEPHPLRMQDGAPVTSASQWFDQRRPEVLELFRAEVYGRTPADKRARVEHITSADALDGAATRKQWDLRYGADRDAAVRVLAYLPKTRQGPAPVFVALNFQGNHTVSPDPGVRVATCWVRNNKALGVDANRATEAGRGGVAGRWPVEQIIARGYGLVTACYGDLDPDFDDGFGNGVHAVFDGDGERRDDSWGAIGAWAWGLSRILDSLAADEDFNATRAAVLGHSRLGKTALWAGAQDQRFWMVISNNSGCGGAACSRRRQGETVAVINKNFPHWFCKRFHGYADREDALPVDQHLLLALCAPRPLYVASAQLDSWADPDGEFLSARGADAVYRLVCGDGLPAEEMPALDQPAHGRIGYHVRTGKHDLTPADWEHYLDFADLHRDTSPR